MNLPQPVFPPTDLHFPTAQHVRNAEVAMDDKGLYVTLATDANWGGTFLFDGDNIAAIREALTPTVAPSPPFVRTPGMCGPDWSAIAAASVAAGTLVVT